MWKPILLATSVLLLVCEPALASTKSKGTKAAKVAKVKEEEIINYAKKISFRDPKLVLAIAKVESSLNPKAKAIGQGRAHYGLLQISYETAKFVGFKGKPHELYDWRTNIRYSTNYLNYLSGRYSEQRHVIAAYNSGSVFYCRKKCKPGKLVNEEYVTRVLKHYRSIEGTLASN